MDEEHSKNSVFSSLSHLTKTEKKPKLSENNKA